MRTVILLCLWLNFPMKGVSQQPVPVKPRVLISTDIGGTDPDDNQSLTHLMMYSDRFTIEGLVSSPSYGEGTAAEILRMIDLYEKDLPRLSARQDGLATPAYLRSITRQGRKGSAPYAGYGQATEGSEWIIQCAKKKNTQPLWVLGWGGLEDIAQALHDAPEIQHNIRVYWIGGPNKKWSANSYAYIVSNFPNLWFIENNASYYGFFSNVDILDSVQNTGYYTKHIGGAGHLGDDFKNYYKGEVKMGDTPSLLYLMDGDPGNPLKESWGGSFEKLERSPRVVYDRLTTAADSVAFCTVVEFHFRGPELPIPPDSACFWLKTGYRNSVQRWPGYYLGNGNYSVRYIPKQAETIKYELTSEISNFPTGDGQLTVTNRWPGKENVEDYSLGSNWYSDRTDPTLYHGRIQGGKTVSKWRQQVLLDWAKRWHWLK